MIIQQISVFLENRLGTLAEVLATLNKHNINIRAMSIAETSDFGILRFIVNHPETVAKILKEADIAVKITPVLTMILDDNPGKLLEKIQRLSDGGINVEYFYAFAVVGTEKARIVLKVDNLEKAQQLIGCHEQAQKSDANEEADFYW